MNKKYLSQEQTDSIINLYKNRISTIKIAKLYNVSSGLINRLLKKENIKIRRCGVYREYFFNHRYFSIIDTPIKAYFLGFLFADGYNNVKNGYVSICLQATDKYILEKLIKELGSSHTLEYKNLNKINPKLQDIFKLTIYNRVMSKDLEKLGCVQKKSLILKFPSEEQVPKKFLKDFIRGYFDGDGCISLYPRKRKGNITDYYNIDFSITSTFHFLNEIKNIFKKYIGVDVGKILPQKNVFRIKICHLIKIQKIFHYFYDDTDIDLYLTRKYEKFFNATKIVRKNKYIARSFTNYTFSSQENTEQYPHKADIAMSSNSN